MIDLGAGVLDVLHDTAKHPRVGVSRSFLPGMTLEIFPPCGGPKLGEITVKSVLVDKRGRYTGRLELSEALPSFATKGCLLLYQGAIIG